MRTELGDARVAGLDGYRRPLKILFALPANLLTQLQNSPGKMSATARADLTKMVDQERCCNGGHSFQLGSSLSQRRRFRGYPRLRRA